MVLYGTFPIFFPGTNAGWQIGTPLAVSKVLEHPDVAAEDKSVDG